MRAPALAALLATLLAAPALADHATLEPSGLVTWPASGPYLTTLLTLPNRALVCIEGPKAAPLAAAGGANVTFMVWTQKASTHLWVYYEGENLPQADRIVVFDHGQVVAELPVLQRVPGDRSVVHVADLPGDLWNRVVAPRIPGGGVELGLADVRLPVPAEGFEQAAQYADECVKRLAAQPAA